MASLISQRQIVFAAFIALIAACTTTTTSAQAGSLIGVSNELGHTVTLIDARTL